VNKRRQTTPIVKAEAKILLIMCYYIVLGTLVLTVNTYYQVSREAAAQTMASHFSCQSAGVQSGRDCGDLSSLYVAVFNVLSDLGIILIGLLPAVILMFTVACNCNNKHCKYRK
jgi:uncharacterized membrane protein YesL